TSEASTRLSPVVLSSGGPRRSALSPHPRGERVSRPRCAPLLGGARRLARARAAPLLDLGAVAAALARSSLPDGGLRGRSQRASLPCAGATALRRLRAAHAGARAPCALRRHRSALPAAARSARARGGRHRSLRGCAPRPARPF